MSDQPLVLSLFPGIGLLDHAFELEGFCVVRGPDPLWGGDIRRFNPPAGRFDGVIGGPPCQAFSPLTHLVRRRHGMAAVAENLIPEYERVVGEAAPAWFVMENSPFAPLPEVDGYIVRDLVLNNRWLGEEQNRKRRFSFGTHDGKALVLDGLVALESPTWEAAVIASTHKQGVTLPKGTKQRSVEECAQLQGLPRDFLSEAPFTVAGKYRVIGNGVPIPMGRAIARAVRRAIGLPVLSEAAS